MDKGASGSRGSRGAVVTLMKGDTDTSGATAQRLIAFAKSDRCSKPELSALLHKLAATQRADGETEAQSFVKCITTDPLGRELFGILQRASGRDHAAEAAAVFHKLANRPGEETNPPGEHISDDGVNPFHAAIEKLVDKFLEAPGPGRTMTRERAYDHIATKTKLGQDLLRESKGARFATRSLGNVLKSPATIRADTPHPDGPAGAVTENEGPHCSLVVRARLARPGNRDRRFE